jgi:O-antigen/teichoic acid export membrane protein
MFKKIAVIRQLLSKKNFSKNVAILMSGTVASQIIPIAISPVLTRLFDPHAFGVWGVYMALFAIMAIGATGRFEYAIFLPKSLFHAKEIVALCFSVIALYTSLLFLFLLFFSDSLVVWLGYSDLKTWVYILPFHIAVFSAYQTLYYWNNRTTRYNTLAFSKVIQSTSMVSANLYFGFSSLLKNGLIIGSIMGNIAGFLYVLYHSFSSLQEHAKYSVKKMYILAFRYKNFPKFMVLSGFIEALASYLPVLLLGKFYTAAVVGLFILSQRIIKMPITLLGSAIADVFKQRASEAIINQGNCQTLFMSTLKKLVLVSTIPFIVLYFAAPSVFAFVFGEEWRESGVYASILTPMFYFQFITSPLSTLFMLREKQHLDLYLQIFLLIGISLILFLGSTYLKEMKDMLAFLSAFYCLKYLIELKYAYTFSKGL